MPHSAVLNLLGFIRKPFKFVITLKLIRCETPASCDKFPMKGKLIPLRSNELLGGVRAIKLLIKGLSPPLEVTQWEQNNLVDKDNLRPIHQSHGYSHPQMQPHQGELDK